MSTVSEIAGVGKSDETERLMQALDEAQSQGLLRALDVALARFIAERVPAAPPSLLMASAVLSRLEGLGHVCVELPTLAQDPLRVVAWPQDRPAILGTWLESLPVNGLAAKAAWRGAAAACGDAADADPQTPLVLDGDRLYLRRYWALERRVARQLTERATAMSLGGPEQDARAQSWLNRLFPAAKSDGPLHQTASPPEVDWQRLACEKALNARFTLITGGPGTGKTYTAARLLLLLQAMHEGERPLRVGLAAPTGKAAARLLQSMSAGIESLRPLLSAEPRFANAAELPPARTLHALLGVRPGTRRFRHDAERTLPLDVLLVDEASMVHLELMDALLQAMPANARLVLLGDSEQLASVEAGSVLGDICSADPASRVAAQTVRLISSRRFAGRIGQAAEAVKRGDAKLLMDLLQSEDAEGLVRVHLRPNMQPATAAGRGAALESLALDGAVALRRPEEPHKGGGAIPPGPATGGHAHWLKALQVRPPKPEAFEGWVRELLRRLAAFGVLCAVREGPRGVAGLNALIEREATARGWLRSHGPWYEGRPVMVTRNDAALRLFNGDIGLVLRTPSQLPGGGTLRAWFDQTEGLRSVAVTRLPEVETAFAMTVHKSQGSEFDDVLLVMPDEDQPLLTRELLYTGMTRARRSLTLACADDEVLAQATRRSTWRMSGLRW